MILISFNIYYFVFNRMNMHTLHLQIDDSIFEKFMGLLDILPKEKISVSEKHDASTVSTVEEVQKRVFDAESNANYVAADDFWEDIEKKTEAL